MEHGVTQVISPLFCVRYDQLLLFDLDWFVSRNNAYLFQQLYSLASASLGFHCCTVFIEAKERKGSF